VRLPLLRHRTPLPDLAVRIGWEQSRFSHQVLRMGARSLVKRRPSGTDARATDAILTEGGAVALRQATLPWSRGCSSTGSTPACSRRCTPPPSRSWLAEHCHGPAGVRHGRRVPTSVTWPFGFKPVIRQDSSWSGRRRVLAGQRDVVGGCLAQIHKLAGGVLSFAPHRVDHPSRRGSCQPLPYALP
jgi:hypothetical protein